ncbi:iron-containing alcohol dehydrogenase [Nocardia sp. NEAU-G5]|uniref:Iron-containing alcohol dehydrogenase n=1 Tax=Nocardia albiluteola TaxID=2842303 RepID=A0ABS6B6V7_9NOCA|nr:iron-containing alcohol dehydrogenase [Nocardia albiluteola]MBU3062661.1 iron-containing alcohol dehydrogenase [Nocardia albiluteola]MBU3065505.1 iron-containing alcohol dehydrogenase [Nocardia albiluteola]
MTEHHCGYAHSVHAENWDITTRTQVIAGAGSVARLGGLLHERGARRVLIVTDPGLRKTGMVDDVAATITTAGPAVTIHSEIPANPSTASLDVATAVARDARADFVVAIGGGSALDAAKAVALLAHTSLSAESLDGSEEFDAPTVPLAAIPTTAGTGAETNGFGVMESADHRKVYIGTAATTPELVILDAELTVGLPAKVTAAAGFDAIIHGAESLLSQGATSLSRAYATESLRLTVAALADAVADGSDIEARSRMLIGSHLAGRALSLSGLGLVHGIGHSITATTGTPHGVALASIAGPALAFGAGAAQAKYADLVRVLDLDGDGARAAQRIEEIAATVGLPTNLGELGVGEELVETLVTKTLADAVTNNTPLRPSAEQLAALLRASIRSPGKDQ